MQPTVCSANCSKWYELAQKLNLTDIFFHREVTAEETNVEKALANNLAGIKLTSFWGGTLHHLDDLPMSVNNLPDVFTQYRKAVEKQAMIRTSFPSPDTLPDFPREIISFSKNPAMVDPTLRQVSTRVRRAHPSRSTLAQDNTLAALNKVNPPFAPLNKGGWGDRNGEPIVLGELPSLESLGVQPISPDKRGVLQFRSGESRGIERLRAYIWEQDYLQVYKKTPIG